MKTWHYLTPSRSSATVQDEGLDELVTSGQLTPQTMVWTDGMADWQPASAAIPQIFARAGGPPPLPAGNPPPSPGRRSHEVDFEIIGDDLQMIEIELDPGETVIAEAGAMNYMDDGIGFETKMGDGSTPDSGFMGKLMQVGKRMVTGESLFMTHFTNRGQGKRRVAFAAPYPGSIIPVDLSSVGGNLLCQKDAFLCAALGTQVGIAFNKRLGAGFFGGEGFILQKLTGDGMAFVHAGGTIVRKELKGEKILVDTGCLVAFTQNIEYDIERAGNLKSMVFGGEGLFLATLRGHGTVWLQSLPFSRMANRIIGAASAHGGRSTGEGSVLGGLGSLFENR
jgi:uncharacterized protein (TIGR00266 family)